MLAATMLPLPLPHLWRPIPLISAAQRAAGFAGGEGGQWPRALAVAPDGQTIFLGIDVGGILRSRDGGRRWERANVGYSPRGCIGLAIDPADARRVLAVGGNSSPGAHHGVYLSTDGGGSWRSVLPANLAGLQERREQIAFDPSSVRNGRCRVAYWSRLRDDKASWGEPTQHPAIYRSDDGGETWTEIPDSAAYAGGILRIDARTGALTTALATGVWRSVDGAKSWSRIASGAPKGVDLARDGTLVYNTDATIFVARPGRTATFTEIKVPGATGPLRNVKVSPLDPKRMVVWSEGANWDWRRWMTDDGGATWVAATKDATGAFLPDNAREGLFAWSPKASATLWSLGGDWPTISTDGGRTYRYSGQGDNALFIGGAFHFNAQDPDLLFFGSQDYNGASTRDGGVTWRAENPSGNGWGGFTYGGYALDPKTLVVGNASGWGGPRMLRVSDDGGRSWRETGQTYRGLDTAIGDPKNARIAFASQLRTVDAGKTWTPMSGCDGVLAASIGTLYGLKRSEGGANVVVSKDSGSTWQTVAKIPGDVGDIAATPDGTAVYVAAMDLFKIVGGEPRRLTLPRDQFGSLRVRSVAVDPGDPNVIYVAANANTHSASNAAMRSRDGGVTWEVLTLAAPPGPGQLDGGREACWVRVHPRTREPWFATNCYGLWRLSRE